MVNGINGLTKVCGIFGKPLQHTFSPGMHNAAFAAVGLNNIYVPFEVEENGLPAAVKAIRALGLPGVNITIPYKEAIISHLDEVSVEAGLIGAVNPVVNRQGCLYGENTDGRGFLKALSEELGFNPAGKTACVLGAGGAARAVAVQLALAGVKRITLANRSMSRAVELARFIMEKTGTPVQVGDWPSDDSPQHGSLLENIDLVVQATPIGMHPQASATVPLSFEQLKPGAVVCDLIYNPGQTRFLEKAAQAGAITMNGLGMLLYQGVLAFELWTGRKAPVQVMREALRQSL